jgi:Tol biopolymer transport system component
MYSMKKLAVFLLLVIVTGCANQVSVTTDKPIPTIATSSPNPTESPVPTFTMEPTVSPSPMAMLAPTSEVVPGRILYIRQIVHHISKDVILTNADGSNPVTLVDDVYITSAVWSPDGSRVALNLSSGPGFSIYVVDADDDSLTQIYNSDMGLGGELEWSPDGSQIAFWVNDINRSNSANIYIINADGSNQRQLTNTDTFKIDVAWSPDGTQIAYSETEGFMDVSDIYVVNVDDEELSVTQLTQNGGWNPVWSPDGSTIVFVSYINNGSELTGIYLMDADGGNIRLLAGDMVDSPLPTATLDPLTEGVDRGRFNIDGSSRYPKWSPDGTQIAFLSGGYFTSGPYNRFALYVINVDGTGLINLSTPGDAGSFDWSPDGDWIAFASYQTIPYEPDASRGDIYLIHPDGTDLIQLTDSTDEGESSISWQPDPH